MIKVRNLRLEITEDNSALYRKAAKILHISESELNDLILLKKSIDARKKHDIHYVCTAAFSTKNEKKLILEKRAEQYVPLQYDILKCTSPKRPIVVGFGPAGMFASLVLAEAGLRPIILERGDCVEKRIEKVESFWNGDTFDPESNVQFGEGGAGTFSDGKLNTGTNDPRIAWVLSEFHRFGAHESITYDAKPHIGTDVLVNVVRNIRKHIISLGGEIHFRHRFCDYSAADGVITVSAEHEGAVLQFVSEYVILALGHSSRDTFELLYRKGLELQQKPFSIGVRIEHPQSLINIAQYGKIKGLPPADYKLNCRTKSGSAYTFCMCPGGSVVAAASEPNSIVTNGMSDRARDKENANSALLVSVTPEDFPNNHPLAGMYWQREIEQRAFAYSGSYRAPAQLVGDFLNGHASAGKSSVNPSYRPSVFFGDIREVLPKKITDTIAEALPILGRKLKGFDDPDAVMTAPETRSSSPVRIVRGTDRTCINGLYPCGEGAGYAGGITSAAVDGMKTAEAVIQHILSKNGEKI